jgi:hypothetical protein
VPLPTGTNDSPASPASVSDARASTVMLVPGGTLPWASVFQVIRPQVCPATPPSCTTDHVPTGAVISPSTEPVMSL